MSSGRRQSWKDEWYWACEAVGLEFEWYHYEIMVRRIKNDSEGRVRMVYRLTAYHEANNKLVENIVYETNTGGEFIMNCVAVMALRVRTDA